MRASTVGRTVAVVGMSLALGALEARAQTVVPSCEQLLILEAAGVGGPGAAGSAFVLGVARDLGPDGWVTRLVLRASDEGLLCVPGAPVLAAGASAAGLSSGENVYVRGFGFLAPFANSSSANTLRKPRTSGGCTSRACLPKLSRAE
jgi:hypothetical protein